MDMINVKDYDCTHLFDEDSLSSRANGPKLPETGILKLRADKQETEDFYLNVSCLKTFGTNLS